MIKMRRKKRFAAVQTHTRDEVVTAIREKGLAHVREVMNVLGWKNEEGCSKCRPALNYYLGMVSPETYKDDQHVPLC